MSARSSDSFSMPWTLLLQLSARWQRSIVICQEELGPLGALEVLGYHCAGRTFGGTYCQECYTNDFSGPSWLFQMWVGLNLSSQTDFSGCKEALVKFQILCLCYLSFFRKCSNAIFLQQNLSFILLNGCKFLFWFFSPEKSSAWGRYALQSHFILSCPWHAPCICCTHFSFSFHLPCCFTKCQ